MFTVTWLSGVGPLHLDLLEPNKWRVYLFLQNSVPCMSVGWLSAAVDVAFIITQKKLILQFWKP